MGMIVIFWSESYDRMVVINDHMTDDTGFQVVTERRTDAQTQTL